ncbi:hypothetical protein Pint_34189 [Pistacia integerrima]|uniref:Uncharacterized protein n=1 Tax=Pistacia integerrima TaxID=434235 RepID=A0ACC0X7K3_9ROSI|nr:hypothetical protein Pint_34189 [Pistacia integerrima]
MGEGDEVKSKSKGTPRPKSNPGTPRPVYTTPSPPISAPPSQLHSPSLTRSPLLASPDYIGPSKTPKNSTPRNSTPRIRTPRFITPLSSPIRAALKLTRLDPHDAWLPITESRNGNAYYAAFHTLCAGIGIQALVLPVAFPILGWSWGVISLTLIFIWQLYTLYILVALHESVETGMREKLAKWLVIFPLLYLSAGTCMALVMIGGSTSKIFYETVCGGTCSAGPAPLTPVEWHLVFTGAAVILSQLPNLNSIAGVSLIGAVTAVGYCTSIWVISVTKGRMPGVSYDPIQPPNDTEKIFDILNALGIVAFAFRGHNLTLEIQATMPSDEKHPSTVPMWRGVKFAYLVIAICIFPLAIGGYWAYGQLIPENGGMLTALYAFHRLDTSRFILGLTSLFVIINAVSSFQIYGMPVFDALESVYTRRMKGPCPWFLRSLFRVIFGFFMFFLAVAVPLLGSSVGLVGGVALPVTLAYPCFMWLKIKKPKKDTCMYKLNWLLGLLGLTLSAAVVAGGVYVVITKGFKVNFFHPN